MTRLSNRQYPLLKAFAASSAGAMSFDDAHRYDQRPFRSMLMRGWVTYDRRAHGFRITKAGREAWDEFLRTDISRKSFDRPLTKYFDAQAYGLHEVRAQARGAAA